MADNRRIYVEKLPQFRVEADCLRNELNESLGLSIKELRLLNVYDLFGFSDELLEASRYSIFGEIVTDTVTDNFNLDGYRYLAMEYLPGQFDQRAASATDCVKLIDPQADVKIKSSRLFVFDDSVNDEQADRIAAYFINPVESRLKDLGVLSDAEDAGVKPVPILDGFRNMNTINELELYCKSEGLAMNADDLRCVVDYFIQEGRDPNQTELRILDTYWSDHCRHTTFTTEIEHISIDESFIRKELEDSLGLYGQMRRELGREDKSISLMDIATIGGRYLHKKGLLDDLEQSEENNACSIYVDVDVDGKTEKWLLQFKNETHNHPTEIEPFGGASTCLGGAIRDPLSGRAYVYQAMRVTGAGDIYKPVSETLAGKLPQRIISSKAASGYSSYGNQIGLATTHVREIYHDNYVAKRLEVGAVVGAVRAEDVRRESPVAGDVVLLLGGRTGRDGVGGATGSSKQHDETSLERCSSEVQKGNAPEERKLQRLFRRPEVTRLIKKSNDFGAGGVSVAIGELTDGLDIYLDKVPVKYKGLNSTELAISESQERMAVVVERNDMEHFVKYCSEENVEVTHIADVTDTRRMRMFNGNEKVVDLTRDFIDSAGARHFVKEVNIKSVENRNPFKRMPRGKTLRDKVLDNLNDRNVLSQKGMIEMFDSTVGASTVLMPYGGRTQRTETQVSAQKLPVKNGSTNTASIMAYGYDPDLSTWSPYHGAAYAIVDAVSKVVAAGGKYDRMRFSYQEYFERMSGADSWGKPLAALLGALRMQEELGLPAIGGKDSMSGTFGEINVPPMLMAFGVTTVDANNVISPEFKRAGSKLYLISHKPLDSWMPDTEQLKNNFVFINGAIADKTIISAWAIGKGGICEAVAKMSFGNEIGATIELADEDMLWASLYGSVLVESAVVLNYEHAVEIGITIAEPKLNINGVNICLHDSFTANTARYEKIYPAAISNDAQVVSYEQKAPVAACVYQGEPVETPVVYLPVFPGTNCDYDTAKAFEKAGAKVESDVFCNLTSTDINLSIDRMCQKLSSAHIFAISGGFSSGDEPDGSGKFIASVLNNKKVTEAIHDLLDRGGLMLGICNGFQALVKSGLLPYGRLGMVTEYSPTLFRNDINRHISQVVTTRIASVNSPWLSSFNVGDLHSIAVSHGEGKFVVSETLARQLFENGQVAFQYADSEGMPTMQSPQNPNGSLYAIEGIVSPDGRILGKMGHTERYEDGLLKNISGNKVQDIFGNAIRYFRKK